MRRGDFEGAWGISDRSLRNRLRERQAHRDRPRIWCGEPLDGKRVLVRCSHGLGDTLQFIRFVPLLQRFTGGVIVQVQPALAQLLAHVGGLQSVIATEKQVSLDTYDVAIDLTELPHIFRTKPGTMPAPRRYIKITPHRFRPTRRLRVGLVWEGSDWDERRAVPVQLLSELDRIAGVTLHIVQRGPALFSWRSEFGIDSGCDDVYEAARTIAALDLMITIDSMPAHLAAAMGVPTWVLLHSDCDWRWMQNRSDSPWYPSMRLFRQKNARDWIPVIARIKQELERLASSRRSGSPCCLSRLQRWQ
jgi:hypothetical protein